MAAWSDDEVARLFDLRRSGLSQAQIAATLGRTKCAVGSVVKRLNRDGGIEARGFRGRLTIDWEADDDNRIARMQAACVAHLNDLQASAGRW